MDVWYTNLATLPKRKCYAHRSQIETMIVTMKRLYPQRQGQIDRAVNTKLAELFSEGEDN